MRDDFDNLRAERDLPYRANPTTPPSHRHAGLWKQIAIGIVVGHLSLGLIGTILWLMVAQLLVGTMQINLPWAGQPQGQ